MGIYLIDKFEELWNIVGDTGIGRVGLFQVFFEYLTHALNNNKIKSF